MKKLWLVICAGLLLAACGGSGTSTDTGSSSGAGGAQKLELKADGKDSTMEVKSGVMQVTAQDHSNPEYQAAIFNFTLANYELKTNGDLARTLTKPEETRVYFKLYGDKGTDKNAPLKPGTYKADAKSFPMYDPTSLAIIGSADGKQTVALSQNSPANDTKGEVKITSVEGDTVKGEINIMTGSSIAAKGSFTAKIKPIGF
ncbi:MAG TPA: hypothetical protein VF791_19815 [Pyrinomonadaceae bacterium]